MRIEFFCPLWGREDQEFSSFLSDVHNAGYDGVEMGLPTDATTREAILKAVRDAGLKLIVQHHETAVTDFAQHKAEYASRLRFLAAAEPEFISSQTGRDFFTIDQTLELLSLADDVGKEYGVKIVHETHRRKFSFAAHVVHEVLKRKPDLRLTLDISHWCAVAETLLEDQTEAVDAALARADHIHARVGFAEGPQVGDPFSPSFAPELAAHLGWWDRVVDRAREEGRERLTITPEAGPVPYMPVDPATGKPVADQWTTNLRMRETLLERYRG